MQQLLSYERSKTVRFFGAPYVGIDKLASDGAGGRRIERDWSGEATGLLYESARDIIEPLLTHSVDDTADYISDALQLLLRHGVTSAHACEDGTWSVFCRLADQGRLPLRVFYSAYYDQAHFHTGLHQTCNIHCL